MTDSTCRPDRLRRRTLTITASLALLLSPAVARAQGTPVGSWTTEYYRTSGGHGDGSQSELIRARLTLMQRGDSVVGLWQDLAAEGSATPRPRGLRGVIRNGAVTLVADSVTAVMRQHLGPERRLQLITTYELAVRGDSLIGTQRTRSTDGAINNNPRRFVAVRAMP